jgi:lysozyme family protein
VIHSSEKVQEWLIRILGAEGEYWDDPVGGPTKWGISKRSYPHLDIRNLTIQDAETIYRRDFLTPLKVDRYDDGVAFQLLDFAVNSGQPNTIKAVQKELGAKPDGIAGKDTIARMMNHTEAGLIMLIVASRLSFMTKLQNWPENSRGWVNRMVENLRYAANEDISRVTALTSAEN